MLRTSISPNVIQGGYRYNVIPSEAQVRLDVRALPDEDIETFLTEMKKVINDAAIEVVSGPGTRPKSPPAPVNTQAFRAIEHAIKRHYGVVTLPTMATGASDRAQLKAKGIPTYGIGPVIDLEDAPLGFGSHSDQERILEAEFHRFRAPSLGRRDRTCRGKELSTSSRLRAAGGQRTEQRRAG